MQYPIEYKQIPTQYAFLVEETGNGFIVKTQVLHSIEGQKEFKTQEEVDDFINQQEII